MHRQIILPTKEHADRCLQLALRCCQFRYVDFSHGTPPKNQNAGTATSYSRRAAKQLSIAPAPASRRRPPVAAFHDACERLNMPPLVAAAVALDAALVGPDIDPDEFADMLANMADDLRNYGRLGSVIEFDTVRPGDPESN